MRYMSAPTACQYGALRVLISCVDLLNLVDGSAGVGISLQLIILNLLRSVLIYLSWCRYRHQFWWSRLIVIPSMNEIGPRSVILNPFLRDCLICSSNWE